MHGETVHVDDVFDVAPRGGHFSFRSGGRTLRLGTLSDLLTVGIFFIVGGLLLGGAGIALAVAAAFLYPTVRQMRHNRVVKRALFAA